MTVEITRLEDIIDTIMIPTWTVNMMFHHLGQLRPEKSTKNMKVDLNEALERAEVLVIISMDVRKVALIAIATTRMIVNEWAGGAWEAARFMVVLKAGSENIIEEKEKDI